MRKRQLMVGPLVQTITKQLRHRLLDQYSTKPTNERLNMLLFSNNMSNNCR